MSFDFKNTFIAAILLLCLTALTVGANEPPVGKGSDTIPLNAVLSGLLEIDKVIVGAVYYKKNENFTNMAIENIDKSNPNAYKLSLTPIRLKLHTNLNSPVQVTAAFNSLKSADGSFSFNPGDIYFVPNSLSINNPIDGVITNPMIPTVITRTKEPSGKYNGVVTFTTAEI